MRSAIPTFEVFIECWVEERFSGVRLLPKEVWFAEVHPPVWGQDDPNELELHLEHGAKLSFLRHVRKTIQEGSDDVKKTWKGKRFLIKGVMHGWRTPTDGTAPRELINLLA